MWRTLVGPVLHRQVGILRSSASGSTSHICFIHITGHGDEIGSKEEAKLCKNHQKKILNGNNNILKANNVVVELFRKVPPRDTFSQVNSFYLHIVESEGLILSRKNKDRHLESIYQNNLTMCLPREKRNEKHSGFGFSNIFLSVEKWCYGVVVVSSLISWHRLFLKDETYHTNKGSLAVAPSHILPVNGPAKPIDPLDAAIKLFEDAVAECAAVTQNALGIQFLTLNFHEKAFACFKNASYKGNIAANFNLGLCYEKGIGTSKNMSKAVDSYDFAASRGHLEAGYSLGRIYLEGKHVCQKSDEGLNWMEVVAMKGLTTAQQFLGLYYADDTNEHYDMKTSVKWLQVAADQNDMIAQYHLGVCYERGFGISRNMQMANELYGQAAENGHTGAQYNYAVFHEHGLGGLSVDKYEAMRWYKMASRGGNSNAKHNLDYLQKELSDLEKVKGKSSLLRRVLPDIWYSKEIVSQPGIIPRCASSPDRLYTTAESPESQSSPKYAIQQRTFEDKKCVWVI